MYMSPPKKKMLKQKENRTESGLTETEKKVTEKHGPRGPMTPHGSNQKANTPETTLLSLIL